MTTSTTRSFFLLFLLVFCCSALPAQTNISGTINQYSTVTAIDFSGNMITVSDPGFFAVGDRVLLIQMKGATIDETNSSAFGDVSDYGGAGNYELVTICEIAGSGITLENELVNTDYDAAGSLQLITVPEYKDAVVSAELTGQAWNGATGGVVALSVTNDLTLDAPVVMDGKGFRGGAFENNASNCSFLIPVFSYFYDTPTDGGGKKGESIAPYISAKEYGRGAQAAGGGGGNDHNSGGGGGANAGAGGVGGDDISTGIFNCSGVFPGRGGKVPSLTTNRVFLGSGGGAGDGNNFVGTSGGNGGGIIFIFTGSLTVGASAMISANGISAINTTGGDGGGGGGAGGSIYLEAGSVAGTPLLSVNGGKGADVNNEGANRCFGPGGGGGGGLIRTNTTLPAGSLVISGGLPGESLNTSASDCTGSTGSEAGGTGLVLNEAAPEGTIASAACLSLPLRWQDIILAQQAKKNLLSWSVASQVDNDFFTVERSADGQTFNALAHVDATSANDYNFTDAAPLSGYSFYRVKQTDLDGRYSYSPTVSGRRAHTEVRLYPSLARAGQSVTLELPDEVQDGEITLSVVDQSGRSVWQKPLYGTGPVTQLETTELPAGVYHINLRSDQLNWTGRLVIVW